MQRLAGKKALITGAAQGIGRATVEAFSRNGATVTAIDINATTLSSLANLPGVIVKVLDITDINAVKNLDVGPIDILFNCAGYVHHGTILDCDENAFDFSFNLNVKSMFYMCKKFLPEMIKKNNGVIINMSSIVSSNKAAPNRFAYASSKAAVIGLTKSIAIDYVQNGVRCNCLCPGTVDTPSFRDRVSASPDPKQAMSDFIARQKMGRVGSTEEIANLCVYLASDESTFTTGTEFVVDGGWSL